ncbi:MAG: hypothetical protein JWO38_4896 [Gemmataceae bacterium]|nr:hypothetical protein [Gemmataceae bacterium]
MSRSQTAAVDPLDRLDVPSFVDCVRTLRTAQLAAAALGEGTDEVRALEQHVDEWLLDLGRPPALPMVWSAEDDQVEDG